MARPTKKRTAASRTNRTATRTTSQVDDAVYIPAASSSQLKRGPDSVEGSPNTPKRKRTGKENTTGGDLRQSGSSIPLDTSKTIIRRKRKLDVVQGAQETEADQETSLIRGSKQQRLATDADTKWFEADILRRSPVFKDFFPTDALRKPLMEQVIALNSLGGWVQLDLRGRVMIWRRLEGVVAGVSAKNLIGRWTNKKKRETMDAAYDALWDEENPGKIREENLFVIEEVGELDNEAWLEEDNLRRSPVFKDFFPTDALRKPLMEQVIALNSLGGWVQLDLRGRVMIWRRLEGVVAGVSEEILRGRWQCKRETMDAAYDALWDEENPGKIREENLFVIEEVGELDNEAWLEADILRRSPVFKDFLPNDKLRKSLIEQVIALNSLGGWVQLDLRGRGTIWRRVEGVVAGVSEEILRGRWKCKRETMDAAYDALWDEENPGKIREENLFVIEEVVELEEEWLEKDPLRRSAVFQDFCLTDGTRQPRIEQVLALFSLEGWVHPDLRGLAIWNRLEGVVAGLSAKNLNSRWTYKKKGEKVMDLAYEALWDEVNPGKIREENLFIVHDLKVVELEEEWLEKDPLRRSAVFQDFCLTDGTRQPRIEQVLALFSLEGWVHPDLRGLAIWNRLEGVVAGLSAKNLNSRWTYKKKGEKVMDLAYEALWDEVNPGKIREENLFIVHDLKVVELEEEWLEKDPLRRSAVFQDFLTNNGLRKAFIEQVLALFSLEGWVQPDLRGSTAFWRRFGSVVAGVSGEILRKRWAYKKKGEKVMDLAYEALWDEVNPGKIREENLFIVHDLKVVELEEEWLEKDPLRRSAVFQDFLPFNRWRKDRINQIIALARLGVRVPPEKRSSAAVWSELAAVTGLKRESLGHRWHFHKDIMNKTYEEFLSTRKNCRSEYKVFFYQNMTRLDNNAQNLSTEDKINEVGALWATECVRTRAVRNALKESAYLPAKYVE